MNTYPLPPLPGGVLGPPPRPPKAPSGWILPGAGSYVKKTQALDEERRPKAEDRPISAFGSGVPGLPSGPEFWQSASLPPPPPPDVIIFDPSATLLDPPGPPGLPPCPTVTVTVSPPETLIAVREYAPAPPWPPCKGALQGSAPPPPPAPHTSTSNLVTPGGTTQLSLAANSLIPCGTPPSPPSPAGAPGIVREIGSKLVCLKLSTRT